MERELLIRLNKLERKLDALLQSSQSHSHWLPIGVAAKRLGISTRALYDRARRGSVDCWYDPASGSRYFDPEVIASLQ